MAGDLTRGERILLNEILRKHGLDQYKIRPRVRPLTHSGEIRPLSKREREVLAQIAHGYTNEQIATTLFISEETVKTHVRHLLDKLDARSRAHAVAIAFRNEILHVDEGTP